MLWWWQWCWFQCAWERAHTHLSVPVALLLFFRVHRVGAGSGVEVKGRSLVVAHEERGRARQPPRRVVGPARRERVERGAGLAAEHVVFLGLGPRETKRKPAATATIAYKHETKDETKKGSGAPVSKTSSNTSV